MKITFLCCTYGRPYHLEECIQSFRLQKLPTNIRAEMLILNTCPDQKLKCDMPDIRILNHKEYPSMSQTINAGFKESRGDWVAPIDDDDISLPFRLYYSVNFINNNLNILAFRQQTAWVWNNGNITGLHEGQLFGNWFVNREYFLECGGAEVGKPCDCSIWNRLMHAKMAAEVIPTLNDIHFIMRWKGMGAHYSAQAMTISDESELLRIYRDNVRKDMRFKTGQIDLIPHWKFDYSTQAAEARIRERQRHATMRNNNYMPKRIAR